MERTTSGEQTVFIVGAPIAASSFVCEALIRCEGIGVANINLALSEQFKLLALEKQEVGLKIKQGVKKLDLVVRTVQGNKAMSNDDSWRCVENLQVSRLGESA